MKFWEVEIDETIFKKLIIAVVIGIVVYMAFTMSSLLIFKTYTIGENTSEEDTSIRTHIDSISTKGKKIEITGYAYQEGKPIEKVNSQFVIKNQETGKMYLMRTQMEQKEELEAIGCQLGGLHAQCLRIGLPKGKYQIFVWYRNDGANILADTLIPFDI